MEIVPKELFPRSIIIIMSVIIHICGVFIMNYSKNIKQVTDYDIIVAGAGPAGIAAAAAAGREGKKVLLIEASGQLGGMATTGLVPAWTPYSDGVRIIYGGISENEVIGQHKTCVARILVGPHQILGAADGTGAALAAVAMGFVSVKHSSLS